MAAYPSYNVLLTSEPTPESGWLDDIADAGSMHSRRQHSKQYVRFTVIHHMTGQQYQDLLDTYAAGPRDEYTAFTFHTSSPQTTYTVQFIEVPAISRSLGNNKFEVTVNLRGWED